MLIIGQGWNPAPTTRIEISVVGAVSIGFYLSLKFKTFDNSDISSLNGKDIKLSFVSKTKKKGWSFLGIIKYTSFTVVFNH